jgi:hypothetical protein
MMGGIDTIIILWDGEEIGRLRNGDTISIIGRSGKHKLTAKSRLWGREFDNNFSIMPAKEYEITVGVPLRGGIALLDCQYSDLNAPA